MKNECVESIDEKEVEKTEKKTKKKNNRKGTVLIIKIYRYVFP